MRVAGRRPVSVPRRLNVVVSLDSFKGTADASAASRAVAAGILQQAPEAAVDAKPFADGGEGTIEVLVSNGWRRHTISVCGPTGLTQNADFAATDDTVVVELAQAAGLTQLHRLAPMTASTVGVGQIVLAALELKPTRLVLAVGGSASTDGGTGLLTALGVRVLDAAGEPLPPGGIGLQRIHSVDVGGLDPRLQECEVMVATDVDNPLLGETGAAAVFGPQKGATPGQIHFLDAGLDNWAQVVQTQLGTRCPPQTPGAGAAGGVAFGAMAVLGASAVSGARMVAELIGLPAALAWADVMVVGEGRLDTQSLGGKAPVFLAEQARAAGASVVAVAGVVALSREQASAAGIQATYALIDYARDLDHAKSAVMELLTEVGGTIGVHLREQDVPWARP